MFVYSETDIDSLVHITQWIGVRVNAARARFRSGHIGASPATVSLPVQSTFAVTAFRVRSSHRQHCADLEADSVHFVGP